MFDVTYLGHQGWLIEAGTTRVLVDPLLTDGLGNMPDDVLAVYPPRRIDLASFPAVSAVVFTHEHPDHLSIPSLLRLDRGVDAILPARTSTAARGLLRDLGFAATLMHSGEPLSIGELEIHPFHSAELTRDEWDVVPIVIRDRSGHGSFATSIDAPESPEFARFAVDRAGRLGIWASSHNHMDLFAVGGTRQERDDDVTGQLSRDMVHRAKASFQAMRMPQVLAVLSSGFTFKGDLAWMNRHVFPGAAERLAPLIADKMPGVAVRAPHPGQRFTLSHGELAGEEVERPFLGTLDRSDWPAHAAEPHPGPAPDYDPACGRRAFSPDDVGALLEELRAFATHLYGGPLFRAIYAAGRRDPSDGADVGFALRTESEPVNVAYRPEACEFQQVASADPRGGMAAGMACWASDLLAVLRVQMFSGYLLVGRYRKWSSAGAPPCDLDAELMSYCHPLRQPARTLAQYRRTVAALGAEGIRHRVPAGS